MIGVVGPDEEATRLADAVSPTDGVAGGAADVVAAGPDVVVAAGDAALTALVRAEVDAPVLPVDCGEGLNSVPASVAPDAVEAVLGSAFETRANPVLEVAIDGDREGRGLFDAMLVTSEPARISEFAVETGAGFDQYRADGVVVATPAGSHGYARAVGGPVLDPNASSLAVVPVAAFAIRSSSRVASAGATLTVSVERDEGDISLLIDGDVCREVPTRRPVTVRVVDVVETVVPPGRLEKL